MPARLMVHSQFYKPFLASTSMMPATRCMLLNGCAALVQSLRGTSKVRRLS